MRSVYGPKQHRETRAATVRLPFRILAGLLDLPAEATIEKVVVDPAVADEAYLVIRGAGWRVWEGCSILFATPTFTEYTDDEGRCFKRVITWDLPQP